MLAIWSVCALVACGDSGNGPGADAASNGNDGAAQQCGSGQTEGLEECVVFGGSGANMIMGDTWELDGTDWVETTPVGSPPARQQHAMVYDSQRQVVVLFGGRSSTSELGDTWEYNGTTWVETTPALSPAAPIWIGPEL